MHIDTMAPEGRLISRTKIDVGDATIDGRKVVAGSVIQSTGGWRLVLIPKDGAPVTSAAQPTERQAREQIWTLADALIPDFVGEPSAAPRQAKPRSRAKATVIETATAGRTPRHHGRVDYIITGETESQIMHQVRKLRRWYNGYGISFGELETIDGVLTLRGSRSDNCE